MRSSETSVRRPDPISDCLMRRNGLAGVLINDFGFIGIGLLSLKCCRIYSLAWDRNLFEISSFSFLVLVCGLRG